MHGSERPSPPPAGPRYRRHLAEQPRPAADPFACGTDDAGSDQGPDFYASYESDCEAAVCSGDGRIYEDDLIRAIGHGEYAHADCAEDGRNG